MEEEIIKYNKLTEERIRNNVEYVRKYRDKWNNILIDDVLYVELQHDKGLYLETDNDMFHINIENKDDIEEAFRFFVCSLDSRANVDIYVKRRSYDLIIY